MNPRPIPRDQWPIVDRSTDGGRTWEPCPINPRSPFGALTRLQPGQVHTMPDGDMYRGTDHA